MPIQLKSWDQDIKNPFKPIEEEIMDEDDQQEDIEVTHEPDAE